jgi:hypothetical protein
MVGSRLADLDEIGRQAGVAAHGHDGAVERRVAVARQHDHPLACQVVK